MTPETKPLAGRTALITGGSRGIGRAIALEFAASGAVVEITYAGNAVAAAETVSAIQAAGGTARAHALDISDASAIAPFFAALRTRVPALDILVNNAGIGVFAGVLDTSETDMRRVVDTNLIGTMLVSQAAAPLLAPGGTVITISSGLSRRPSPRFGVYSVTKAALDAMTILLAAELAPRGITANTLAPGWTATDINAELRADPAIVAAVTADTALGRIGEPEDIANAALLLASPEARWITGQYVEASGGFKLT